MPKRRAWIRPNTFFVRTRGECPFAPNADRQDRDCGHSGDADPAFYSILSQEDPRDHSPVGPPAGAGSFRRKLQSGIRGNCAVVQLSPRKLASWC